MTWGEALVKIQKGERFEDPDILRLADFFGWSVAHAQACRVWTTEDPSILKLTTDNGWTVSHEQARRGWTTLDPYILSLTDTYGKTVLDIMLSEGWEPKTEEEKLVVFTVKAET